MVVIDMPPQMYAIPYGRNAAEPRLSIHKILAERPGFEPGIEL